MTAPGTTTPRELLLAFAPLHKSAFGAAIGVTSALLIVALTGHALLRPGEPRLPLELLAVYLRGYSVSWTGALIGALWGGAAGFVFGWFAAFCRNLALAVSLFVVRTRSEMSQTRDFLDHI